MPTIALWRQLQRRNFTNWQTLLSFLELNPEEASNKILASSKFPLNLPLRLAEKIKKNSWEDPVLLQFLPSLEEEKPSRLFVLDPVADTQFQKTPKLLHKYLGRALLLCSSACAMHCRYCFRRHYDYETSKGQFEEELQKIREDDSLSEILLSGGDPLSLGDTQLGNLLTALENIPHVKRIRFHTRFPVGIPERIDSSFLELLASCKKQVIFVIHTNHANELDADLFERLKQIQKLGIPVLTQSVLLKGINDTVEALQTLFETLIDNGVLPYYLHQLDRVQGAVHFEVSEEEGKKLMKELQKRLPGYAVPKYVKEEAHQPHKTVITSSQAF
jgi:EF-P beta-lysylation protein EpmB